MSFFHGFRPISRQENRHISGYPILILKNYLKPSTFFLFLIFLLCDSVKILNFSKTSNSFRKFSFNSLAFDWKVLVNKYAAFFNLI